MKKESIYLKFIIIMAGIYGLFFCLPGFRPKHIRDIIIGFQNIRGLGTLNYFLIMSMLMPMALTLKDRRFTSTLSGGIFATLSILFSIELIFSVGLGLETYAIHILRLAFASLVLLGFYFYPIKNIPSLILEKCKTLLKDTSVFWKIFIGIILFFFIRQAFHMYLTRGLPFDPFGDEIAWWHTMGKKILLEGTLTNAKHYPYTEAVPWLISLPARIFGSAELEWMIPYPLFIFFLTLLFILEVSKSSTAFILCTIATFMTFLANRDLFHLTAGTLYGEAIATLLTAIIVSELYLLNNVTLKAVIGISLILSIACNLKPPLSVLCQIFLPLLISIYLAFTVVKKRPHILYAIVFGFISYLPYQIWKYRITAFGHKSEHVISLQQLIEKGIDISIPLNMLYGLSTYGSFQFAFALGLLLSLLLTFMLREIRLLKWMFVCIFTYWGFVLSLYATFWQHMEQNSAGRYMSHAAIACVLLLSLIRRNR